jgi:hypothetical protein
VGVGVELLCWWRDIDRPYQVGDATLKPEFGRFATGGPRSRLPYVSSTASPRGPPWRVVSRHEHVLLIGETGVGKRHVAQARGGRECMDGHQVLFTLAHDMLTQLRALRANESVDHRMLRFVHTDLRIIDDGDPFCRPRDDKCPRPLTEAASVRLVTSSRARMAGT